MKVYFFNKFLAFFITISDFVSPCFLKRWLSFFIDKKKRYSKTIAVLDDVFLMNSKNGNPLLKISS